MVNCCRLRYTVRRVYRMPTIYRAAADSDIAHDTGCVTTTVIVSYHGSDMKTLWHELYVGGPLLP